MYFHHFLIRFNDPYFEDHLRVIIFDKSGHQQVFPKSRATNPEKINESIGFVPLFQGNLKNGLGDREIFEKF